MEGDYDFPTVYFIGLMDFTLHKDADRVDFRNSIREDKRGERMNGQLWEMGMKNQKDIRNVYAGCGGKERYS